MNKAEQRALLRKRIAGFANKKEASKIICEKLIELVKEKGYSTILSYCATADEADLSDFDGWAKENGKTVACPVCVSNTLEAYVPAGEPTENRYGIKEPDTQKSRKINDADIELVIVPCVGYDLKGHRLGHGKGYYDRFLNSSPACRCLVGFDCQKMDEICIEEHDVKMDLIISEKTVNII